MELCPVKKKENILDKEIITGCARLFFGLRSKGNILIF
jgi:hypothetical protein